MQSLRLLSQIIEKAKEDDAFLKRNNPSVKGDSWMVFHLQILEELLKKELNKNDNSGSN